MALPKPADQAEYEMQNSAEPLSTETPSDSNLAAPDNVSLLTTSPENVANTLTSNSSTKYRQQEDLSGSSQQKQVESYFWLTTADSLFVGCCVSLLLILLTYQWIMQTRWGTYSIEVHDLTPATIQYQIDINSANWVEWMQLEGVGEKLAKEIVRYRELHGPFNQLEDLLQVKGVGKKTLEKLRPRLIITVNQYDELN